MVGAALLRTSTMRLMLPNSGASMTPSSIRQSLVAFALMWMTMPIFAVGPTYVDITWLSITNGRRDDAGRALEP